MTDDAFDPPKLDVETHDDAGDDEAVDDNDNASGDEHGTVGEEA